MADVDADAFCLSEFPRLVGALGLYTGDVALAEDLAQEALARAMSRWEMVSSADSPGAYVHRIAMNLANSHFRRQRQRRQILMRFQHEPPATTTPDPTTALAVREAVMTLPFRQRQVVVLRYLAEFTLAEIAEVLGITEGGAKALNHRGTAALRTALAMNEEDVDV